MDKNEPLFIMAQPDTFQWPVKVRIPRNGRYAEASFIASFPNMGPEEVNHLVGNDEATGKPRYTDREIADKVLIGFDPIAMPDGSMVTFSEESKARLLAQPRAATSVVGTFLAVTRGFAAEVVEEKNA